VRTIFSVTCPYCGESLELYFEEDVRGSLIQDCEVCCRPLDVRIEHAEHEREVAITPLDD